MKWYRRLFHFHNWLYRYERYPARVHAFTTGPGPDWIDRMCYECDTLEPNKNYQAWLDYVAAFKELMELERKVYGHPRLTGITTT